MTPPKKMKTTAPDTAAELSDWLDEPVRDRTGIFERQNLYKRIFAEKTEKRQLSDSNGRTKGLTKKGNGRK